MKTKVLLLILVGLLIELFLTQVFAPTKQVVLSPTIRKTSYWLLLERQSNTEKLYRGVPGDIEKSTLTRSFKVKTGVPGERPTPLPDKLGREYWLIASKQPVTDNSETAPYFLTLDIPFSTEPPFGPAPYDECNGQCNWQLPGSFGLHGVAGDFSKLDEDNRGSSGCIRHTDEDITYLYQLLTPEIEPVHYYIEDI